MLRSLLLLAVYAAFFLLGLSAPFVLTLGYVWVDTVQPQNVAYILLNQFPVAMVMGGAAIASYFALDRRSPPRVNLGTTLQVLMAAWITLSMAWAEVPSSGWIKWDWAFKTIAFSAFVPLVIRSRVQIEAFLQVYVFALAANIIPFGVKTLISGGGYGVNLGLQSGNAGQAEGGLLSTLCLMAVPLALHLGRHGQLTPRYRFVPLIYMGIAFLAVATALGTYERSALVGLVMMALYMFSRSRNKAAFGVLIFVAVLAGGYVMSKSWTSRISTIEDYNQESSALVRILVWKWTLGYALSNPFGGGFNSYLVDHVELPGGAIEFGRAFHSIYFEVLGEEGWPGLAIFLLLSVSTMLGLRQMAKRARKVPELLWCADMSNALQAGLIAFLTSGAFVGIAFQPMYWYFIAMAISLRQYMYRVEHEPSVTVPWRNRGSNPNAGKVWEPARIGPATGMRGRAR